MSEALRYRSDAKLWADIDQGEFGYSRYPNPKWLFFWPHDCRTPLMVSISPQKNGAGATWALIGTREAPTLHPSVHRKGGWHGWLRNGVATAV